MTISSYLLLIRRETFVIRQANKPLNDAASLQFHVTWNKTSRASNNTNNGVCVYVPKMWME